MALRESPTCSELLTEAFGAPEPGDLKFTLLQQLLKAILSKLALEDVPFDQVQSSSPQAETPSAPTETSPAPEPTPVDEVQVPAPEQEIHEPVIRFEDTDAYQDLLSNITNLQNTVDDLKLQLTEQTAINKAILPTVEQLDQFSRSRSSSLHSTIETSLDYLSLAARLDKMDESIGKLTSMANDTVLEYARLEKSVLPYLGGGELAVMRAQLNNINQLLKANFPGFRAHCSSASLLKMAKQFSMDSAVPIDFYQHPVPSSVKSLVPRRSTIKCLPDQDVEKELDTIRSVLTSVIARLPLPELEATSEESPVASCPSLELTADTIRAIWPREFEELLRSCNERIEALEKSLEEQTKQSNSIASKCTECAQATDDLELMFVNFRQAVTTQLEDLYQGFKTKLHILTERLDVEQMETETHLDLLDQQMEDRVEYKHFQTRLSKEQFSKTIEQLESTINAQVDHFSCLINRIENRLKNLTTDIQAKPDRCKLDRLESKMRNRFNFFHLVIDNLRNTLRKNVEAAGAKIQLGAEPLRCVSCNHEATMRQLEDVIPTGIALRRCAEKQQKQRIKQLNELVARIAPGSAANKFTASLLQGPKQGSTAKAKMEQPEAELAYVVHAE